MSRLDGQTRGRRYFGIAVDHTRGHALRRCGAMLNIAISLLPIAATGLQVLDVLSTYHMLARGGHEANPIVAWFMRALGDAWPLCKLPEIAVIVILWAFVPRLIALIGLGLMIAGYSFVVWHNYQI
jgi:hypothetical protein